MMKSNGFFYDFQGNKSYGRMASFLLVLAAIGRAFVGNQDSAAAVITAQLASAVALYTASKAQQAYTEGKHGEHQDGPSTGSTGETC